MSIRGIAPEILFQHIDNTASFLFQPEAPKADFLDKIRSYRQRLDEKLSHLEYFDLCLSAHYSTVATYVPTDVDNQIRHGLWNQRLTKETSESMVDLTVRSRFWNFRVVTARALDHAEKSKGYIAGHHGEWFSVAVGAYARHRDSDPKLSTKILQEILAELQREIEVYLSHREQKSGLELLKTSTIIAHNLGDLDRVMDQWNLPNEDSLRKLAYKLGHEVRDSTNHPDFPLFMEAGALNKAFMASENHRHYPLRAPKALRRSLVFLLPIGPFFDAWGAMLAQHPALTREELADILCALVEGFEKLSSTKVPLYGYARALSGILRNYPGGLKRMAPYLPAKVGKKLIEGNLHRLLLEEEPNFAELWRKKALQFLKL